MNAQTKTALILLIFIHLFCSVQLTQAQKAGTVVKLSEFIGENIDQAEQKVFHLFPDIKGFK